MNKVIHSSQPMVQLLARVLWGSLFLAMTGCQPAQAPVNPDLQNKTDELTKRVEELTRLNQQLSVRLSTLETSQSFQEYLRSQEDVASFDPHAEKQYSPVKGPAGPMLLVLDKVEPYLDGFTVHMRVGNPTSANFSGMQGKVKWGKRFDAKKDAAYNQLAEKDLDLKDTLLPGYWTAVKFNVAPAKAEDVGRIIVEPTFSTLRMRN